MRRLRDLSIRYKLMVVLVGVASFVLVLSAVALVVSEALNTSTRMQNRYQTLANVFAAKSAVALSLVDVAPTGPQEELDGLNAEDTVLFAALYDKDGNEVGRYVAPPEVMDRYDAAQQAIPSPAAIKRLLETRGPRFSNGYVDVVEDVKVNPDDEEAVGKIFLRATAQPLNTQMWRSIGIAAIVLVVAIGTVILLSLILQSIISAPILDLAQATKRVSAEHDYTVRVDRHGSDELGVLADGFNLMLQQIEQKETDLAHTNAELEKTVAEMRSTLQQLKDREAQLESVNAERERTIEGVRQAVQQLSSMGKQLMATISEQTTGSQTQSTAVSQVVATVSEVARTAEQSAERAEEVAKTSREADEVGNRGRQAVNDTVSAMGTVRQQVESIAENILSLAERAQQIGEITSTVNDIAEQTNVLALNAAVEASRAGEHGKGFAVVAAEVKSLAEESKKATSQVRHILSEIQQATNAAVLSTEQGTKSVTSAGEVVAKAGDVISTLSDIIAKSARAASQISASAGQQAAGISQVRDGVKNIDKVTKENALAVQQIEQSAQSLHALSNELASLVSN